jgi:hypothetical protein
MTQEMLLTFRRIVELQTNQTLPHRIFQQLKSQSDPNPTSRTWRTPRPSVLLIRSSTANSRPLDHPIDKPLRLADGRMNSFNISEAGARYQTILSIQYEKTIIIQLLFTLPFMLCACGAHSRNP